MSAKGAIELLNVNKYYGDHHVVKDLSFSIRPGEFISLLGPSGCGKTTILRMIAGFEAIDGGNILLDGSSITRLEPNQRSLNTIFQNYALFPHMNVFDNVAYGLRARGISKKEIRPLVTETLDMVRLSGFDTRFPAQMSGGQKQRVSIARAVINRPPLLLLDEPLTALDMKLRKEMRFELRRIQQLLGITFIYVTHDQEEALVMSDRIAVMNGGRIEQAGTPAEIYSNPVSQFVAEFIGETNTFDAVVIDDSADGIVCKAEFGHFPARNTGQRSRQLVHVSIRPNKIRWTVEPVAGFLLPGVVRHHVFTGSLVKSIVELSNGREVFLSKLAGEGLPDIGQQLYLSWDPDDAVVMHTKGEDIFSAMEEIDLGAWIKIAQ